MTLTSWDNADVYLFREMFCYVSFTCAPMYTSQLWWNYKKCTMKRLLITYHNVFKMSMSMSKYESTSLLCTVYNVLCCQAVIGNLVYRFMCRLQASNNSLVMSIQSSSLVYTSRIRKHWRRILYVNGWFLLSCYFCIIIIKLYYRLVVTHIVHGPEAEISLFGTTSGGKG